LLVGYTFAVPLVGLLPLHPPEAAQLVTLLDDQESVAANPLVTVVGAADRDNRILKAARALQGQSVVSTRTIARA
jgi:hypothetical protein